MSTTVPLSPFSERRRDIAGIRLTLEFVELYSILCNFAVVIEAYSNVELIVTALGPGRYSTTDCWIREFLPGTTICDSFGN